MSFQKLSIYQNGVLVDGGLTFDENNQAVITVKYESEASATTGVGFALSFDNSVLGSPVVSDVDSDAMVAGVLNEAGDVLEFGFVSLFGQFPGTTEADLATITFTNSSGSASAPMPSIEFTSTAAGFEGQIGNPEPAEPLAPLEVTTYDIDENSGAGQVLATVDNADDGETFAFAGGDAVSEIVVPDQQAATQHVYVSESTKSEDGSQVTITLSYKADNANTTGVGFTLGFDSSVLTLNNVSDVFSGAIATGNLNPEGDGLGFGWASLFGQFPGANEAVLATITFDIADGASGSTGLDIAVESAAAGFAFEGQPHDVVISAEAGDPNLSIDSATGTVTLVVDPDFEDVSEYSFEIMSSNDRTVSGTSAINNLDEVPPTISSGSDAGSVDENGAAQVVYTATADDSGDISGGVTFSLSNDSDGAFSIDAASGAVTFVGGADFETQPTYNFSVIATDAGGNASAPKSVTLDIANVDEVAPTITSGDTATTLVENTGARQVVYTATADDSVDTSGGVTFSLAGADADKFEIDSSSGDVLLITDPDADVSRGGQAQYNFEVVAADAAGHISAPKAVTLDITNVDDSDPYFVDGPTVNAGSIAETHVKDVLDYVPQVVYTADANDDADDVTSELSYSVSSNHGDIFSVDAAGNVSLNVAPDYESADLNLDEDAGGKFFIFTVTVLDGGGNDTDQVVKLYLTDVGEVAPTFTSDTSFSFDENNAVGQVIYTVTAVADASVGGSIQYSLTEDSDSVFTIDGSGNIMINESADYESDSQYAFAVKAEDDNDNYAFLSFSVSNGTITVNNLDEVAPTITSEGVADAINEADSTEQEDASGQVVYTAVANDSLDTSAGVTFSLDGADAGQFAINSTTGEVTLNDNPDFETKPNYSFTVIADDGAIDTDPVEKTVTLAIINLDEIAPTIISGGTADSVNENGPEQVVYTAKADDSADFSDGVSFSLADESGPFSIDSASGEVTFAGNADYETQSEYNFSVIATDAAGNASDAQLVTLNINNVDDTAPVLPADDAADAIDEANSAKQEDVSGKIVYEASVDDSADVSDGVTFSLAGDDAASFTISNDAETFGQVTLIDNPNFEGQAEYSFDVIATDAAGNVSAPQTVTLAINNLDEMRPLVTASQVTSLSSYSGAGQVIYTPDVVDDSSDKTSEPLTYSLSGGNPTLFAVDENTGVVTYIPNPVTDGSDVNIVFQVTVTDGSENSTAIDLSLKIQGKENNAPVMSAPSGDAYEVISVGKLGQNEDTANPVEVDIVTAVVRSIDETASAETVVYTSSVADDSDLSYTLSGADAAAFNLKIITAENDGKTTNNAEVSLVNDLDFVDQQQYNFSVNAIDASGNQSSQDVRLFVSNLSVEDNSSADQVVYLAAADFNFKGEEKVSYSLTSDNDALVIDADSGVVTYLGTPDYETSTELQFTVTGNGVPKEVTLNVVNSDDNAPTFTSGNSVTALDEDSGANQVVYTPAASDADAIGDVTFSLEGDDAGAFTFDSDGNVILVDNPDHEAQSSYSITVVASDDAGNQSRQSLSLKINDEDEIAPVFLSSGVADIDENSEGEVVVYTASAHSAESLVEQGPIRQELVRNDDGTVTVKLYVDSSVSGDFADGILTSDFKLSYESEDANSLAIENIAYHEEAIQWSANDSLYGEINFAVILGVDSDSSFIADSGQAIAEVTFKVGNADALSTFTVADVGFTAANAEDMVFLDGQSVYQYAVNDGGRVVYRFEEGLDDDAHLFKIDSDTGVVTLSSSAAGGSDVAEISDTVISVPEQAANTQHIYVSDSQLSEDGSQVTVTLSYKSDDSTTTGVGFAVNFDSSILSLNNVSEVANDAIAPGNLNADGNALDFGFASLFGSFPGTNEAVLAKITFDIDPGATDYAQLDLVGASNAAGMGYDLQSQQITVVTSSSDAAESVVTVPDQQASTQHVYVSESTKSEDGTQVTIKLSYKADDANTTGVGFAVNFDSSILSLNNVSEVANDAIAYGNLNADGNALDFGFASLFGQFPGSEAADLATITFDIAEGATGSTALEIEVGSAAAGFAFDGQSHDVVITAEPVDSGVSVDYEAEAQYNFTVVAEDQSGVTASQIVTVSVNDLDEVAPTITVSNPVDVLNENTGANTEILSVSADDSGDTSDGVTLELAGTDAAAFEIDAEGKVTLKYDLDHEAQSSYSFSVVATDLAGNSSEVSHTLTVKDLDEVAPTITVLEAEDVLNENTGANAVILSVSTDDSADASDGVTLSLAGADADDFTIADGKVTLIGDLNHEAQSSYSFSVVATDAAGNTSEVSHTLSVTDIDEILPTIISADTALSIDENTEAGSVVYTAEAKDFEDVSGGVTFSLAGDDADAFAIDAESGVVVLTERPNFEDKTSYTFTVEARDGVNDEPVAKTITIDINNLDEFAPTITSGDTAVTLKENSGSGLPVYTATATDVDDVSGGVTFSLEGDDADAFEIDAESGVVKLLANPNYEAQPKYNFTVKATDAAGFDDTQDVTMNINPVTEINVTYWDSNVRVSGVDIAVNNAVTKTTVNNDSSSIDVNFADSDVNVSLSKEVNREELTSAKGPINSADALAILRMQLAQMLDDSLDYSDSDPHLFYAANFNSDAVIDSTDALAVLKYSNGLDVDHLAEWKILEVEGAQDQVGSEDIASYTAVVKGDVTGSWADWASEQQSATGYEFNTDSAPEFDESVLNNITIDAEISSGTVVYTAVATDNGNNVAYTLKDNPAGINIDPISGAVTLDNETVESDVFTFVVEATDDNGKVAESTVTINVNTPDRVAPTITSEGEVAIGEGIDSGVIYTAVATDAVGDITFSLSDDSDSALVIDSASGEVSLSNSEAVDYENQSAYSFKVIATDTAQNSSVKKVVVNINNLDEIAPEITSSDKVATIDENSGAGQVVYTAAAVDSKDISDDITLSLAGDHADKFEISESGEVKLLDDPDADKLSQYNFTVIVSDGVNDDVEQNLTLNVNNLDELAPAITSADTAESINENGVSGKVVYTATAQEPDNEVSVGPISYSLTADSDSQFTIDSSSGEVSFHASADFETGSEYSFSVVATDGADNASDPQLVTMAINDLDEVAPTITVLDKEDVLDENSGKDEVILSISVDDSKDTSDGVTLELAGADAAAFTLTDGQVTLKDDLNHEAQSSYSFSVVATDAAGNKSEVSHTLSVKDLDEVAPEFVADSNISVMENSAAGQLVYTNAVDDGRDASEGLTYSLTFAESGYSSFVNQDAPESEQGIQSVYVSGGIVNHDTDQVEIAVAYHADSSELPGLGLNIHFDSTKLSVSDIKDVLPQDLVFTQDVAQADTDNLDSDDATNSYVSVGWASVAGSWTNTGLPQDLLTIVFDVEGVPSGSTKVGFSSTSNAVEYEFNGESYDIQMSSLAFDESNGNVTLNVAPDYEGRSEYNFTVTADDGNASVDQNVTLSVINVDDTDPTITSGEVAVSIDENSGGKVIYSTQADDSADVSEGTVTYSLAEGHDAAIEISAETGDVYLLKDPDADTKDEYNFTVIVDDGVNDPVEKNVTLTINDLDDAAPTIVTAVGAPSPSIDENKEAGQVVYVAVADDSGDDVVADTPIVFSLTDDSHEAFSIDSSTGEVTFNATANYDSGVIDYSFSVVATDGAGNVSAAQPVTLDINNLDEVAPTIILDATDVAIDENSGAGQLVFTASADDSGDISGGVTFSLAGTDADAFVIDTASGAVTLSANPNYESQTDYSFDVVATDAAGNASTQSVSLDINNLDEIAPTIAPDGNALIEAGTENEVIYIASVVDDADTSDGFTLSLSGADASAFSISNDGQVTLNEAARASGYDFNVVSTDGAGNSSVQAVSVGVYQVVSGPQSIADEAAISQEFTHNPDGSISLNLVFDKEQAGQEGLVQNIDFDLTYDSGTIANMTMSYPADPLYAISNENQAGTIDFSHVYFRGEGLQTAESILQVTFDLINGESTEFTVSNVTIGSDDAVIVDSDGVQSSVSVNIQDGTSGDDIFELGAGYSNVYTGDGVDTLIVTDEADASVVVDFDSGSDKFDMAQLLSGAGYDADSDLEGVFGASLDGGTNVLSFTIDEEVVAEVTLSDGSEFDDDDLSADFSAFIA